MITFNPAALRGTSPGDPASLYGTSSANSPPDRDPAGFASLLRQSQMTAPPPPMPAPPAPAPVAAEPAPAPASGAMGSESAAPPDTAAQSPRASQASSAESTDRTEAAAQNDAARRARNAPKEKTRDNATTASSDSPGTASADAPTATDADTGKAGTGRSPGTASGPGVDPNAIPWPGAVTAPPLPSAPAAGAGPGLAGDALSPTGSGLPAAAGGGKRSSDLKALGDVPTPTARDATAAVLADNSSFATLMAGRLADDPSTGPASSASDGVKEAAAGAAAAGALAPPSASAAAAAPPAVVVATPVGAPDFAQELGLHLSVLAKDGVQKAELHLNPADMGPVSVQITMDGTQAHVAFGADLAATRQAIESGLPQLASALRDAGFTLAGGGVSQHAGGRGGNGQSGGGSGSGSGNSDQGGRSASADTVSRVATAARRIVRQGGVDLFA